MCEWVPEANIQRKKNCLSYLTCINLQVIIIPYHWRTARIEFNIIQKNNNQMQKMPSIHKCTHRDRQVAALWVKSKTKVKKTPLWNVSRVNHHSIQAKIKYLCYIFSFILTLFLFHSRARTLDHALSFALLKYVFYTA